MPEDDDDDEEEEDKDESEHGKSGRGGGGGGHFAREEGMVNGAGGQPGIQKTQYRLRAAEVAQRRALSRHILSQTSQTRGFVPAMQDDGSGTSSNFGADYNNGARAAAAAAAVGAVGTAAGGNILAPTERSPTLTTSPPGGAGGASASGTSAGSGGRLCTAAGSKKMRERISATPVWKRPVVPLSKPYVPVPRKG